MGFTYVQKCTGAAGTGGASTVTATFASPPATNDVVVVMGSEFSNVNAITVTDNHGNTYTQGVTVNASGVYVYIWYATVNTTGSPFIVSLNLGTTTIASLNALHFTATGAVTTNGSSTSTGSFSTLSAGNITMTGRPDLMLLVGAACQFANGVGWTQGAGFNSTFPSQPGVGGASASSALEYMLGVNSTVNAGFTSSKSGAWSMAALALEAATTTYNLSGPSTATVTVASSPFTVLPPSAGVTDTITFSDGGKGGTFSPTSLSFSSGSNLGQTFTYTPAVTGAITLTLTSGASTPVTGSPFALTSLAIAYNFSGPPGAVVGHPSVAYTLTPTGAVTDSVTFSDGAMGGTFFPSTLTWSSSTSPKTFTYTPAVAGAISLTPISSAGKVVNNAPLGIAGFAPSSLDIQGIAGTWQAQTASNSLLAGQSQCSVSFFIEYLSYSGNLSGNILGNNALSIFMNGIGNASYKLNSVSGGFLSYNHAFNLGVTYHVAMTWNFSVHPYAAILYIDGSPVGYFTPTANTASASGVLSLGTLSSLALNYRISDVAIWNGTTLSESQVQSLAYRTQTPSTVGVAPSAWWTLYGTGGASPVGGAGGLEDLSGNGNHFATISGSNAVYDATVLTCTPLIELATLPGNVPAAYVDMTGQFVYFQVQKADLVTGSGATATATVSGGAITGTTLTAHGEGYSIPPTVYANTGPGTNAYLTTNLVGSPLASISITGGGSNYTSPPTVSFSGGGGSGAVGTAVLTGNAVSSVTLSSPGSGYYAPPAITLSGGGGTGAAGTAVMAGTGVSGVTVTSTGVGTGYTSAPTVSFSGGGGTGATATATISNNSVVSVFVTNGGTGYSGSFSVSFSGGGGTGAAGTATASGGAVSSVTITNPGSGYTSNPTISFASGGGTGATANVAVASGSVVLVTVTAAGSGYTSPPTVSFSGGGGFGAVGTASLVATTVNTVSITNGGSAYAGNFSLSFTGGGGTGAAGTANVSGGVVTSVTITNPGSGYTSLPAVSFTNGAASGAGATASLVGTALSSNVTILSGGSGYTGTTFPVSFSGGSGLGATGTANVSGGAVASVTITNPGSGYVTPPSISFASGGGTGAVAVANLVLNQVASLNVLNGGRGFTSAPTLSISGITPSIVTQVNANPTITKNGVAQTLPMAVIHITVTNGGSGYTSAPTVTITPGAGDTTGVGATATANFSGGSVTAITVNQTGAGYTVIPTVAISGGGGTGATAVATLEPFWNSNANDSPWVAYQLPTAALNTDVFTFSAPPGWLMAGSAGPVADAQLNITQPGQSSSGIPIGFTSQPQPIGAATAVPIANFVGQTEHAPIGWGLSNFGQNTGATAIGMNVSTPSSSSGSFYFQARNWMKRTAFQWTDAANNQGATYDDTGHPLTILSSDGAIKTILIQVQNNPIALFQGYPPVSGTYTFSAIEHNPGSPMQVTLIAAASQPFTVLGSTTAPNGDGTNTTTWTWNVQIKSPWPAGLSPGLGIQVTTPTGLPGNYTLSDEWFTPPQAFAPAPVNNIVVVRSGYGYTSPTVSITGGGGSGATATVDPLANNAVAFTKIDNGGTGYSIAPNVSFGGAGITWTNPAKATAVVSQGVVVGIQIFDCGSGYSGVPTISFGVVSGGSGAAAHVVDHTGATALSNGCIRTITLDPAHPGSGYTAPPQVTISDSTGTGAAATAPLNSPAQVIDRTKPTATDMNVAAWLTAPGDKLTMWGRMGDCVMTYDAESEITDECDTVRATDFAWGSGIPIATAKATLGTGGAAGTVASLAVTWSGLNYTSAPTVVFTNAAGDTTGSGASATAVISGGYVTGFTGLSGGSNYTAAPTVTLVGGIPTSKPAFATATLTGSSVSSIAVAWPGANYTAAPTVLITNADGDTTGSGATATATLTPAPLATLVLTSGGGGYVHTPLISFSGGGGTGASATAVISGGFVTGYTGFSGGGGYTSAPTITVVPQGGDTPTTTATFSTSLSTTLASIAVNTGGTGYTAAPLVELLGGLPQSQHRNFLVTQLGPYVPTPGVHDKVFVSDNWPGTTLSAPTDPLPYYFTVDPSVGLYFMDGPSGGTLGTGWFVGEATTAAPHGLKTGQVIQWSGTGATTIGTGNPGFSFGVQNLNGEGGVAWVTGPNTFSFTIYGGSFGLTGGLSGGLGNILGTTNVSLVGTLTTPDPGSMAWEAAIDFSNSVGCNIHLNLPYNGTTACYRALARRFLAVLSPDVYLALEFSNEHFDTAFTRNHALYAYSRLQNQTPVLSMDGLYTQRASWCHRQFYDIFNAAGRGHQIVRTFGSWTFSTTSTANMIAYAAANGNVQMDVLLVSKYDQLSSDPCFISGAAAVAASDSRSIVAGCGYPWTRAMLSSVSKHYLKYAQGQAIAGHVPIVATYAGPAGVFSAKPVIGIYEESATFYVPSGIGGPGASSLRTQLTQDMRYDPSIYWLESSLLEILQDLGVMWVNRNDMAGENPTGNGSDGGATAVFPTYTWPGQAWGKGDGSDGRAINLFGADTQNAAAYDLPNVAPIGQFWRDWAAVANPAISPTPTPTPTPTPPAGKRWFPGLTRPVGFAKFTG